MIFAGALRYRIQLLSPAVTTNSVGEEETTWNVLHTVWAARKSLTLREVNRMAGTTEAAEVKFEIRYQDGINTGMRLEHDGVHFGITGAEEIGNREGLTLFARRV